MKTISTFLFLLLSIASFGQTGKDDPFLHPKPAKKEDVKDYRMPKDSITHKVTYTGVIAVDSVSKQVLFSRAKNWFAHAFVDSKEVIQNMDESLALVTGNGSIKIGTYDAFGGFRIGYVKFQVEVACKDGRCKYRFTDFVHEGSRDLTAGGSLDYMEAPAWWTNRQWGALKADTNSEILLMIRDLEKSLKESTLAEEKW